MAKNLKANRENREFRKQAREVSARLTGQQEESEEKERIAAAMEATKQAFPDMDDETREHAVKLTAGMFRKNRRS